MACYGHVNPYHIMFAFKKGYKASRLQGNSRLSLSEVGNATVFQAPWVSLIQVVSVIALNVVLNAFEDIELSLSSIIKSIIMHRYVRIGDYRGIVSCLVWPRQRLEHPNQTLDLLSPTILPLGSRPP